MSAGRDPGEPTRPRAAEPFSLGRHANVFIVAGDTRDERTFVRLARCDRGFARLTPGRGFGPQVKAIARELLFGPVALFAMLGEDRPDVAAEIGDAGVIGLGRGCGNQNQDDREGTKRARTGHAKTWAGWDRSGRTATSSVMPRYRQKHPVEAGENQAVPTRFSPYADSRPAARCSDTQPLRGPSSFAFTPHDTTERIVHRFRRLTQISQKRVGHSHSSAKSLSSADRIPHSPVCGAAASPAATPTPQQTTNKSRPGSNPWPRSNYCGAAVSFRDQR